MSDHGFACKSFVGSAPRNSFYGRGGMQDGTGERNIKVSSSFLSCLARPPPSPGARGHLLLPGWYLFTGCSLGTGRLIHKGKIMEKVMKKKIFVHQTHSLVQDSTVCLPGLPSSSI